MNTRVQIPEKPTTAPPQRPSPVPFGTLQRDCSCGGSGGGCEECKKKKETLQRHARENNRPAAIPPIVSEVLRSPGQSLDANTRAFFEPRFGHDFSNVRVHTDARAAESASAVQAHAYTVGRDMVFGAAQYAPGTAAGNSLLAHELTHVVQQEQGVQGGGSARSISSPTDAAEREADSVGRASLNGQVAPSQSVSPGSLLRLGANPNCTRRRPMPSIKAIYDARGLAEQGDPGAGTNPPCQSTGQPAQEFWPHLRGGGQRPAIQARLSAALSALGTNPYSCAKGPADATCAAGNCGYTPGAGSHPATICTNNTLKAGSSAVFKAGCVLHESFHATFARIDVDSYSGWHGNAQPTPGYPGGGTDPC